VKDKYAVSNEAYHELSIMSDLPSFSQIRKLTKSTNAVMEITLSRASNPVDLKAIAFMCQIAGK